MKEKLKPTFLTTSFKLLGCNMMSEESWVFAIHTEQYAGNFERDMCADATGMVGECDVGSSAMYYADEFPDIFDDIEAEEANPFTKAVESRMDDHGCSRPCSIWPTAGWFNNGLGQEFKDEPGAEEKAREAHDKWCDEHNNPSLKGNFQKHYSYQSVAIFFSTRPTDEMIKTMMRRTTAFAKRHKLTITGFSLIKEIKSQTDERNWDAEQQLL